jgi:hypothetical protein
MEYEKFRKIEDAKPQAVDSHFEDAVERTKRLTGKGLVKKQRGPQ